MRQIKAVMLYIMVHWAAARADDPPASFIFGDSLVDAGNNNYIHTLSRADMPDNGIDFPGTFGVPTGRFSNGRTIPDIIGQMFGVPFAPPFLAPWTKGEAILKGVNYGSGAAGILNETGLGFIGRINMWQQLDNFCSTRAEIISILGKESAGDYLRKSIFSVTVGANDYLNNYLFPVPTNPDVMLPPQQLHDLVLSTLSRQLYELYNLGARKIIVSNVGPIGCIPYQLAVHSETEGSCVAFVNQLAQEHNRRLKDLIIQLNKQLLDAAFVYANAYDIVMDVVLDPQKHGFETSKTACCGSGGVYRGLMPCGQPRTPLCEDRSKSFFWDPYHPSDAANALGYFPMGQKPWIFFRPSVHVPCSHQDLTLLCSGSRPRRKSNIAAILFAQVETWVGQ